MEPTTSGNNRTGGARSPEGTQAMLEIAAHVTPPMEIDTGMIKAERLLYIEKAEAVGSIPPPTTLRGAVKTGIEKVTGSIATGKNADIVILDKNPLEDVRGLRSVSGVIKFGTYYDRAALDGMLKRAADTKTRLDSERK